MTEWTTMLKEHREVLDLCGPLSSKIKDVARTIDKVRDRHGKVIICGNGGSCAHAQHFAAELVVRYRKTREPIRALALGSNPSVSTAICNDLHPADIFQRELAAVIDPGDCLVAISTSGKSNNVMRAIELAKNLGVVTIGLTGHHGMQVPAMYEIRVPTEKTSVIQQVHTMIIHAICELLDA